MAHPGDLAYRALYRSRALPPARARGDAPRAVGAAASCRSTGCTCSATTIRASATSLGGVALANPLILSSMYYDVDILRRAMGLGFGAVTAKSITANPRPGHPEPNLVRIDTPEGPGLVNCNGFQNPGLDAYRRALAVCPIACR